MWRHSTCGTLCSLWCLFLSLGNLNSEKYSYTVTFIPHPGLLTTLRWPASQSGATSQPQNSLWRKSLGETKRHVVYEPSECCRLKGETQQEASIFRMAVAAGCKVKASFLWAVWRMQVLEAGSKGAAEIKHLGWMKSLYHSLFLNIFCVRVQKGELRSKSNLR